MRGARAQLLAALQAGDFPSLEEVAKARGVDPEVVKKHNPHAHPHPTILNWADKPIPRMPRDYKTVLAPHAKVELLRVPEWHRKIPKWSAKLHAAKTNGSSADAGVAEARTAEVAAAGATIEAVTVDDAVNSLAMEAVRGISEDERHTLHALATNFGRGAVSAQRTRFVFVRLGFKTA